MSDKKEKSPKDFEVGQDVCVYAFGHWYQGEVKKIGRTKVHAEYTTGTGKTRTKACAMHEIDPGSIDEIAHTSARKAAGILKQESNAKYKRMVDEAIANSRAQVALKIEWRYNTAPMRLMAAFQALQFRPGFFRVSHGEARQIIEEMSGIKIKKGKVPVRGKSLRTLEDYIEWALEEENSHDIDPDNLPEGVSLVQVDSMDLDNGEEAKDG